MVCMLFRLNALKEQRHEKISMRESMTSSLRDLKLEYLENKTRYQGTKCAFMFYSQIIFD